MATESAILEPTEAAGEFFGGEANPQVARQANVGGTLPITASWVPGLPASRVAIMAVVDDYGDLVPIPSASELLWELKARWRVSLE